MFERGTPRSIDVGAPSTILVGFVNAGLAPIVSSRLYQIEASTWTDRYRP